MSEDEIFRVNSRFIVIQGWIVDLDKKKIIPKSIAKRICRKREFEKLLSTYSRDFKDIDISTSCIIDVESDELFKVVTVAEYQFGVTKEGRILYEFARAAQRNKSILISTFKAKCHKVPLCSRKVVYLRKSEAQTARKEPVAEISNSDIEIDKVKRTNLSPSLIKVQEIALSESYFNAITISNSGLPDYRKLSLKSMYMAFEKPSMDDINNDIGGFRTGHTSLVRNYNPATLELHGKDVGFPIYLFFNKHKLNIFKRVPAISLNTFVEEGDNVTTLLSNFKKFFREANIENEHYDFVLIFPTLITDL